METKINGSFIERLRDFRNIRHLQKLFLREEQIDGSSGGGGVSADLESQREQKDTHPHLAIRAALSYWQRKSPTTITNLAKITNPIRIRMSYGLHNNKCASATAASLKTLTPIS